MLRELSCDVFYVTQYNVSVIVTNMVLLISMASVKILLLLFVIHFVFREFKFQMSAHQSIGVFNAISVFVHIDRLKLTR